MCAHTWMHQLPSYKFSIFSPLHRFNWAACKSSINAVWRKTCVHKAERAKGWFFWGAVHIQSNIKAIWLHFYQQYLQTAVWAVKASSICGPNQPVVKHWPSTPHPYGLDALLSSFGPMHTVQLVPSPWPGSNHRLSYAALDCGFLSKTALADHCQGINSLLFIVMISAGLWIPSVILNRSHR